jgi:hypothetical protein
MKIKIVEHNRKKPKPAVTIPETRREISAVYGTAQRGA